MQTNDLPMVDVLRLRALDRSPVEGEGWVDGRAIEGVRFFAQAFVEMGVQPGRMISTPDPINPCIELLDMGALTPIAPE